MAGGQDGHDATANGTDATEVDTGGQAEPSFCLADPVTSAALQAALGAAYNPSEDLGEALQAMLTSIASTTEDPPVLSEAVPFLSEIEDNGEIVQRVKRETIALRRKLTTALESQTLSQCWEGYAGERLSNLGALRLPMGDLNIFERKHDGQTSTSLSNCCWIVRAACRRKSVSHWQLTHALHWV